MPILRPSEKTIACMYYQNHTKNPHHLEDNEELDVKKSVCCQQLSDVLKRQIPVVANIFFANTRSIDTIDYAQIRDMIP